MKYSLWLVLFVLFLHSSCDNYVERGIEGQWQMTTVIKPNGAEEKVDTIFYSFKKGVFRYLWLESEVRSFYNFGTYTENGQNLTMEVESGLHPFIPCLECIDGSTKQKWEFAVQKQTASRLELKYDDVVLIFKKY